MVVNADRSAAGRTACIKQVARLQREVLTDIRDNLVHLVEHIAGATFLYCLAIDVEMEMNGLYVAKLLHIHPCTYRRRTIEALGKFPWLASLTQPLLHLTGCEVDSYRHRIIISVGEALRDGLSQPADANHQLCLVLYTSQMIRDEEWFPSFSNAESALVKMTGLSGLDNVSCSDLLCSA